MLLRKIISNEADTVFQMGYKEWAKGRTYEQYVKDNKKEDEYGVRYVYVDKNNNIIGSMIVLFIKIQYLNQSLLIHGLGSIVIHRSHQGKNHGTNMLNEFFSTFTAEQKDDIFLLYSDINPQYYHRFHFKELPLKLQHKKQSICMVRSNAEMFIKLSQLKKSQIPSYF
ncbi:MAG: GNAT family N-acetyltransferase [Bacillus sp. (in: firmicutes)]